MQNPLDLHWKVVKRILRYLKGTSKEGIVLRRSETLHLTRFCDVNWGNDLVIEDQPLVIVSTLKEMSFLAPQRNNMLFPDPSLNQNTEV